jgi:hypothetical protein
MGSRILEAVTAEIEGISCADVMKLMNESLDTHWNILGSLIISWCCSGDKIRTS